MQGPTGKLLTCLLNLVRRPRHHLKRTGLGRALYLLQSAHGIKLYNALLLTTYQKYPHVLMKA